MELQWFKLLRGQKRLDQIARILVELAPEKVFDPRVIWEKAQKDQAAESAAAPPPEPPKLDKKGRPKKEKKPKKPKKMSKKEEMIAKNKVSRVDSDGRHSSNLHCPLRVLASASEARGRQARCALSHSPSSCPYPVRCEVARARSPREGKRAFVRAHARGCAEKRAALRLCVGVLLTLCA